MKKGLLLLLVTAAVAVAGCGNEGKNSSAAAEIENESSEAAENNSLNDKGKSVSGEAAEDISLNTEGTVVTWQEISVTLPDGWQGKYVMEETEEGFFLYQKASYEMSEGAGYLCGFVRLKEWLNYGTGEKLLAYTDDGNLYYLMQPTDFPCATETGECAEEYQNMEEQVAEIADSVRIEAQGLHFDMEQYRIPVSSSIPLTRDMLSNMSDNELWIARNEIYARHGRGFTNVYLQAWFDACSWYEKTSEADEFDDTVLSRMEKDNLAVIKEAEEEYLKEHPYPKEYPTGITVKEDISGDGAAEEIRYEVAEKNDYEFECILTIDGTAYDLNEEGLFITPVADVFYVTDILESSPGLEIAVLDMGPSSDYVTHFYRYDGNGLNDIGEVAGFPFREQNNGRNGFTGQNVICGTVRMDLIETCYLDGSWWYDETEQRLVYHEDGMHRYQPNTAHQLFVDLPLWDIMTGEEGQTISAGQEVFFLYSDMAEWIFVRAKDGTEGYIKVQDGEILNVKKPAAEVFSDLNFFD